MYSIAITTYNRSSLTINSFIKILDNELVSEIVVVDDCSDSKIFLKLRSLITDINNGKIRLYRNKTNLGPLLNKREAAKQCTNDWAILFDSDNEINDDYISLIDKIDKQDNVIYSPETLYAATDPKI